MIMISASIAYFVLGFVSCIALLLIISYILYKKQQKQRKDLYDKLTDEVINSFKKGIVQDEENK